MNVFSSLENAQSLPQGQGTELHVSGKTSMADPFF